MASRARALTVIRSPARVSKERSSISFEAFRGEMPQQSDWTQEDFTRLLHKYGHKTTWVYIAVHRIAHSMAQTSFRIIDKRKEGTPDAVIGAAADPLRELLERPNPIQSRYDLIECCSNSKELTGNTFIEKANIDAGGRPRELYLLPTPQMSVVPDPNRGIGGYILRVNQKEVKIPPERVIRDVYDNPMNPFFGMAPLTAARVAADMDSDAVDWNRSFMKRGAWPSGVLETENKLEATQVRRLERQIRRYLTGKDSVGKLMLLTDGIKYNKIGVTPKDLDWLDARRMSRDEILAVFNVPFAVAGLFSTEQTTARSAGVIQQVKNFYLFSIFPRMHQFLSALNRDLVPAFNRHWKIVPDFRSVPALQDDVEQELTRARALKTMVDAGLPLNAALGRLYPDLLPTPWGNIWWAPNNLFAVKDENSEPPKADPPEPKNPTAPTGGEGENDPTEESIRQAAAVLTGPALDAFARLLRTRPLNRPLTLPYNGDT